jgi:hypothetical protein
MTYQLQAAGQLMVAGWLNSTLQPPAAEWLNCAGLLPLAG